MLAFQSSRFARSVGSGGFSTGRMYNGPSLVSFARAEEVVLDSHARLT